MILASMKCGKSFKDGKRLKIARRLNVKRQRFGFVIFQGVSNPDSLEK